MLNHFSSPHLFYVAAGVLLTLGIIVAELWLLRRQYRRLMQRCQAIHTLGPHESKT